jgi:hypothetical protein
VLYLLLYHQVTLEGQTNWPSFLFRFRGCYYCAQALLVDNWRMAIEAPMGWRYVARAFYLDIHSLSPPSVGGSLSFPVRGCRFAERGDYRLQVGGRGMWGWL